MPGALAVELVHNFSLAHDDVEDGDHRRHHRPAVWSLWGIEHGVNVGDGLFALAPLVMLEACARDGRISAVITAAAARTLSRACLELCEGQFLDLEYGDAPSTTLLEYVSMVERKTGALFGCAAELGALLGGADVECVRLFGHFGRALGQAYQMQDDLLGVWGDEGRTGKPAEDVRKRKRGLPVVLAWERAGAHFEELCRLYAGLDPMTDEEVRRRSRCSRSSTCATARCAS